jgi:hypothetical protein
MMFILEVYETAQPCAKQSRLAGVTGRQCMIFSRTKVITMILRRKGQTRERGMFSNR